jgi:hypothetical protein
MPTYQNYNIYTGKGYAGDLCDSGPRVVQTGVVEDSTGLGFGLAVKKGTNERDVLKGGAAEVYAISLRELNTEAANKPSDGSTIFNETGSVTIMREGYIYVQLTTGSCSAGDALATDDTTGEFIGDTAGAGETLSTNVFAVQDGTAGQVIKARIDIVAG